MKLKSKADGFEFEAYHAVPTDARRGASRADPGIFGVTQGIRELADGFAADGYEVLAPSMFDRQEPGFDVPRNPLGIAKGRDYMLGNGWDNALATCRPASTALKGPVFITGYCYGGTVAWLAACRCTGLSAASAITAAASPVSSARLPRFRSSCTSARRTRTSRPSTGTGLPAPIPTCPCSCTRPTMAFSRTTARTTTRTRPISAACAPCSCSTSLERQGRSLGRRLDFRPHLGIALQAPDQHGLDIEDADAGRVAGEGPRRDSARPWPRRRSADR